MTDGYTAAEFALVFGRTFAWTRLLPAPPKTTGVLLLNALEDQHLPLCAMERELVPCDLEPLDVHP